MSRTYDAIVVGAGLAGLRAARRLQDKLDDVLVLERDHRIGGRLRTVDVDGFVLDRGFQVLQTAYPEAQSVLDYDKLELGSFTSGARIHGSGSTDTLVDPLRHPLQSYRALLTDSATLSDLWKLFRLQRRLKSTDLEEITEAPETTTRKYLSRQGFSDRIIERFFRPFLGGIFLETDLETSSRMFEYVFKMFAAGTAALPREGMRAIPELLAEPLDEDTVRLGVTVDEINEGEVVVEGGETLRAKAVVCAVDAPETLLETDRNQRPNEWNGTNCYYFAAEPPRVPDPILHLTPEKNLINNFCFPSAVQSSYSPDDKQLLSVTTLPDDPSEETVGMVREELVELLGERVESWPLVGRYEIPRALPAFGPETSPANASYRHDSSTYVCGDGLDVPSINGALRSGRRAAEALLADHEPD